MVWILYIRFPISTMESSTTSTKPIKVFRLRGVSASVFKNAAKSDDRDVSFFKVSLQRTYKDGDDFKTTTSFSRDDLPVAEHLLRKAWEFVLESEAASRKDSKEGE